MLSQRNYQRPLHDTRNNQSA